MVQSASQYVEAYRFITASKNSGYDKMKVLLIFVILGSSVRPLIYSHFSNRKWLFYLILKFEKITLISFFFSTLRASIHFWATYWSKLFLQSSRVPKTLHFGHQFCDNWSIQSKFTMSNVWTDKITVAKCTSKYIIFPYP